ncbi:hypothetical protein AAG906_012686 [Vitis piasezkii]
MPSESFYLGRFYFSDSPYSTIFRYSQLDPFRFSSGKFFILERIQSFLYSLIPAFFGTTVRPFSVLTDSTLLVLSWGGFGYSPDSTFSQVFSRIPTFFGTHTDSTLFRYSSGQFFDTQMDSTFSGTLDSNIFRYSHRFDLFPVLVGKVFDTFGRFYLFRCLPYSTILMRSSTLFTFRWESFGYSSRFYLFKYRIIPFPVLTVDPFYGTFAGRFLILARFTFSGARQDSNIFGTHSLTLFRYTSGRFSMLEGILPFPVLARIPPFSSAHGFDSFPRYSSGVLDTRAVLPFPDTLRILPFSVLTVRPF